MDKKQEMNDVNSYRSERKERIAKAAKKKKKQGAVNSYIVAKVIVIIVCVALVALIGVSVAKAYGLPQRLMTAVKVGDRSYSVAEYEYFYTSVYNNYAQQSSEAAESYGASLLSAFGYFDYTKHPEQQQKKNDDGTEQSWAAFFDNSVVEMLQSYDYYFAQCKELGITLDEEDMTEIEESITTVKGYADNNTVSLSRYLSYFYGKGMNEKLYRELVNEQKLAEKYLEYIDEQNKATVTDEAVEEAYNANPGDYQVVDLRVFGFATDGSSVTATDDTTESTAPETTAAEAESTTEAAAQAAKANEGKIVALAAVADSTDAEATVEETPATEGTEATAELPAAADDASAEATDEATTVAEDSEEVKALLAKAEEYASRITDEQSFIDLAQEYCDPADAETFKNPGATTANQITKSIVSSNISADLSEWLFDGTRVAGDKRAIKSDNGEYVYVIFVVNAPYREDDPKVDVRHILVSYETGVNYIASLASDAETEAAADTETEATNETDADTAAATQEDIDAAVATAGETFGLTFDYALAAEQDERYTDAVVNATYTAAYDIYKTYMDDATEDNFAALANQYSADTSSTNSGDDTADATTTDEEKSEGGLYEDVAKGTMVSSFENWIYDDTRTPGEVSIIQSEYGFHIMYFVAKNEKADWQTTVIDSLTADAETTFNTQMEELVADKSNVSYSFKDYAYKQSIKLIEDLYDGTYFNVDA